MLADSSLYATAKIGETFLHKMGFHSSCTEQFPEPWSWIKRRISLAYSLWWPLRVLSWMYLKHSPAPLGPAQSRLQGFGPFERFKVQAFRARIVHSPCTWEVGLVFCACLVMTTEARGIFCTEGFVFPDGLWCMLILLYTHFQAQTVRRFQIKLQGNF